MSWVVPGLVNSLGRSSWKTLESSPFFLLQKNEPTRTVKKPPRPFRVVTARFPHYKIAEADDAESLMDGMSFLAHNILPQVEGKKTSKKIAKWLKLWHAGLVKIDYTLGNKDDEEGHEDISTSADETDGESEDFVPTKASPSNRTWYTHRTQRHTNPIERDPLHLRDPANETENGFPLSLFAHRRKSEGTKDPYPPHDIPSGAPRSENGSERGSGSPVDSPTEGNESSGSLSGGRKETARDRATSEYQNHQRTRSDTSSLKVKSRPRTTSLPSPPSVSLRTTNDFSSIAENTFRSAWANMPLESLQQWVGIPPEAMYAYSARNTASSTAATTTNPNKNANRARAQENLTFFEIPFHFITLLSYPEDDTLPGSRPPFNVLREIALVRQRRIVLLGLTLFTLLLRFSSPDFFCVLLALCNWVGLYLLKNSRKVNVTLAKRSVRQRVGWAKQWANGLFWRRGQTQPNNATINTGNIAPLSKQGTSSSNHQLNEEKPKGYVLGNLHGGLRPPSDVPGKTSANSNPSAQRLILRPGTTLGHHTARSFDTVVESTGMKSRFQVRVHPSFHNTGGIKGRSTVALNEATSTSPPPKSSSPLYSTSPPISPPDEFFPSSASQRTGPVRLDQAPSLSSTPRAPTPGTAPPSASSSTSTSSSPGAAPPTDLTTNPSTSTRRGFFRKTVETKHFQLLPSVSIPNANTTEKATSIARPTSPSWSDLNSTSAVNLSATTPHDFLSDPTITASTSTTTKRRFFLSRRGTRIQNKEPMASRGITGRDTTMPDKVGKNLELSDFPSSVNPGHHVSAIQENSGEIPYESDSGHRRESEKSKEKEEKRRSGGLWRLRRSSVGSAPERSDLPHNTSHAVPIQSASTTVEIGPRQLQVSIPERDLGTRNKVSMDPDTNVNADPEGELTSKLSPTISELGIRLAVEETENTPRLQDEGSGHSQRARPEI